jgi:uridylate kinase
MPKLYIISLGGSLIAPEWPDAKFIKGFRNLILRRVRGGDRFILFTGGGYVCRQYQQALKKAAPVNNAGLDWIGIYATRFNAQLLRLAFGQLAHPVIVENPNKKVNFREKILIAGGWQPGRSTDDDAVRLAQAYRAHSIINLTNVDYIYTKDPRKFTDAKPIIKLSWKELRKIVGTKWVPGKNAPFDPVAAKLAQKNGQRVVIAQGKNLKNLERILAGKKFQGTVIE